MPGDFEATQMLSAVLMAYRLRQQQGSPAIQEIATNWPVFRQSLKDLWRERGLPAESWGSPHVRKDIWYAWADSIKQRPEQATVEHEVAQTMYGIVARTRDVIENVWFYKRVLPGGNEPRR